MQNTKLVRFVKSAMSFSLCALSLLVHDVQAAKGQSATTDPFQARGTFPTSTNPGVCVMPDGSVPANLKTQAVLRKSQNNWQFTIETVGSDSVGTWEFSFAKNGPLSVPFTESFPPPGGWAVVGGVVQKKGIYRLSGQAVKRASVSAIDAASVGAVCTVAIDLTI